MRMKTFLFLLGIGSILALAGWLIVIFFVDPEQAGLIGYSVFYLSLSLTLLGVIFLIGNWLRAKFLKKQIIYLRLNTALRQAIFFAVLISSWAFLQSHGLAHLWSIILFILVLTSLEFFFVSYQRKSYSNNERTNYPT